jgi:hypothetical protein
MLSAPPGLRAAAPATRQWLFAAGELEVDLQAFPEGPEAILLHGQVVRSDGPVADLPVHLRHGGAPEMAVTDVQGEFALGPVAGARATLIVEAEDGVHRLDLDPLRPAEDEA